MNNTGGAYTPPPEVYQAGTATYARLFRESASLNKDRTALIQDDRSITYAALDDRSNRMANMTTISDCLTMIRQRHSVES